MFTDFQTHTFHIPVMGTGYTIDTPVKVAHLGITSVVSIVDDMLIEKMREFYCREFGIPFKAISTSIEDFRAKRITAYLNLMNQIVNEKFENLKKSVLDTESDIKKYIELLPDISSLKQSFQNYLSEHDIKEEIFNWIEKNLVPGKIDVNIMTKVDKENYKNKAKLPIHFNDAHAALRGFAQSDLDSSIVFSAGMNPKLYGYIEEFDDFFPDRNGNLKKKIILKVSDFRSAMIQGKFLAKKGLWVSEFRIESGLNCGGHAFATQGLLMGPILEEFKNSREKLRNELNEILISALKDKSREVPYVPLNFRLSAQGGVGTNTEHEFLLKYYGVDSVGWGTPFLLVDDVVNIDEETRQLLMAAGEEDLYLSNISPLGVPFNSVRGNSKDLEKQRLITEGKSGSACHKKLLVQNRDYSDQPLCTASRQFQHYKLKELSESQCELDEYLTRFNEITEKVCLCEGLSETAMKNAGFKKDLQKMAVSVCPGPNMAYYNKTVSLKSMIDHIYGRTSIIDRKDRPNLFIKELSLYITYLKNQINTIKPISVDSMFRQIDTFRNNLKEGILYYKQLFRKYSDLFEEKKDLVQLDILEKELNSTDEKVMGN